MKNPDEPNAAGSFGFRLSEFRLCGSGQDNFFVCEASVFVEHWGENLLNCHDVAACPHDMSLERMTVASPSVAVE
jgi:hypothetical protein